MIITLKRATERGDITPWSHPIGGRTLLTAGDWHICNDRLRSIEGFPLRSILTWRDSNRKQIFFASLKLLALVSPPAYERSLKYFSDVAFASKLRMSHCRQWIPIVQSSPVPRWRRSCLSVRRRGAGRSERKQRLTRRKIFRLGLSSSNYFHLPERAQVWLL